MSPVSQRCGQCSVRCGSRVDVEAWMSDIGSTVGFDDIDVGVEPLPAGLPRFIPQVDTKNVAALDASLRWPAYAVGLRRVMSAVTGRMLAGYTTAGCARSALNLNPGQLAVLVGYGTDPHVEMFWTHRHVLIEQLAGQRWDLVLAPNYSIYGNYPRAEMLINMRRNLAVTAQMRSLGINAVANLYWFRLEDLKRYEDWAVDTHPPGVAVNLQTFRTDRDWEGYALPGLGYLSAALPTATRVVVTGVSRVDRIAELVGLFGDRLHLVGQNALALARRGAVMGPGGRDDIGAHTADAFGSNVRFYDTAMRQGHQ